MNKIHKEALRDLNGMLKLNTHPFMNNEIKMSIEILNNKKMLTLYKKEIPMIIFQLKKVRETNLKMIDTLTYTIDYIKKGMV